MKKLVIHLLASFLLIALCYGCFLFILGDTKSSPLDRGFFVFVTSTLLAGLNAAIGLNIDNIS